MGQRGLVVVEKIRWVNSSERTRESDRNPCDNIHYYPSTCAVKSRMEEMYSSWVEMRLIDSWLASSSVVSDCWQEKEASSLLRQICPDQAGDCSAKQLVRP